MNDVNIIIIKILIFNIILNIIIKNLNFILFIKQLL